jgi:hypothetical protein
LGGLCGFGLLVLLGGDTLNREIRRTCTTADADSTSDLPQFPSVETPTLSAVRHQPWYAALPWQIGRRARIALVVSACVHLCAIGTLGLVEVMAPPPQADSTITAAIVEPAAMEAPLERLPLTLESPADSLAGGSSFDAPETVIATGGAPDRVTVSPWIGAGTDVGVATGQGLELSAQVAPLGGGSGSHGAGEGNGIGNGAGDGTGTAFFGLASHGQKFVFVVDASSSMRRPSHGPERTLFNKVKLEIMQSVRQLTSEQKFYIVFFNDRFLAMPATSLVAATEESQARYLRWMSDVPSGGQTDPEGAIQLALQLQPDVIYFLSDGEFKYGLVKRIAAMNRGSVVIHTVCFGGTDDNNVSLRQIAEQNGGTYQFVALPAQTHETAVKTSKASADTIP